MPSNLRFEAACCLSSLPEDERLVFCVILYESNRHIRNKGATSEYLATQKWDKKHFKINKFDGMGIELVFPYANIF